MRLPFESFQPRRFARRQQSFIAIAVAIYVAMWAVDRPSPIGGEEFGETRLITRALAYASKTSAELKGQLLAEVKRFSAYQLTDDATLIIISALAATAAVDDAGKSNLYAGVESL